MTEKDFIPGTYSSVKKEGKVTYKSPSNIALVKYWGKRKTKFRQTHPSVLLWMHVQRQQLFHLKN